MATDITAYPGAAEALWCVERQALQQARFAAFLAYIRALQANERLGTPGVPVASAAADVVAAAARPQ